MGNDLITISRLPLIEDRISEVKDQWENKVSENMRLACTYDTIQTVKAARAELTKQFGLMESLRKSIKAEYMKEYNKFEEKYKYRIAEPYKIADEDLKRKICEIEDVIKGECEKRCVEYFTETCAAHGVDFVKYEQMGLKIGLPDAKQKTPKKLFEKIAEWVSKVAGGMDSIDRTYQGGEHDEIMMEYKQTLDVGDAVTRVRERHNRLEQERESSESREDRRKSEAEAVAKVDAALQIAAPQVRAENDSTQITVAFKVTATREQLIKLREFIKTEGIKYE